MQQLKSKTDKSDVGGWFADSSFGAVQPTDEIGRFDVVYHRRKFQIARPRARRRNKQRQRHHQTVSMAGGITLSIIYFISICLDIDILKLFRWPTQVWLLLLVSIIFTTLAFKQVQSWLLRRNQSTSSSNEVQRQIEATNPYFYVFGNLISQGPSINLINNQNNYK